MTDKSCIEKRVAREILSMIEKIYFSEEYAEYRIDYGSKGTRDLLINSIRELYGVGQIRISRGGYYMKIINDYDIKEIALNPAYVTNEIFETMKTQGLNVRWMKEDEGNDKNIFTLLVEE